MVVLCWPHQIGMASAKILTFLEAVPLSSRSPRNLENPSKNRNHHLKLPPSSTQPLHQTPDRPLVPSWLHLEVLTQISSPRLWSGSTFHPIEWATPDQTHKTNLMDSPATNPAPDKTHVPYLRKSSLIQPLFPSCLISYHSSGLCDVHWHKSTWSCPNNCEPPCLLFSAHPGMVID